MGGSLLIEGGHAHGADNFEKKYFKITDNVRLLLRSGAGSQNPRQ